MHRLRSNLEFTCAKSKAIAALAALIFGTVDLLAAPSRAALITTGAYNSVGSAGNGTATVTSAPPTFDVTSFGKAFTAVGPLDFVFPVTYSDNFSVVTYIVTEGVTNNTTSTWTDYHEQIGNSTGGQFTLGSNPVTFVTPADASFTNPSFTTRSINTDADEIDYTGGAVAPGQAITLTFSISVPDFNGTSPYSFTLRQFPTVVPEPASLGLLTLGLIGLLARRKRN